MQTSIVKVSAVTILMLHISFNTLLHAQNAVNKAYTDTIPLGGNAWIKEPAAITDEGVTRWSDASSVASIYFRVDIVQDIDIALRLKVPEGKSEIKISYGKEQFKKQVSNTTFDVLPVGTLHITKPGYIKVELRGISKTGAAFADVSDLIIRYQKQDTGLVYVKNGSSFHFGRRGPSVHLRYPVPENLKNDVDWFYNEITVPSGNDKLGSYFMANGFSEGYFGMQVNSETERRILFSVWSSFETDDPGSIPDSLKIVLLKKGTNVITNDFGNEGSGGQSYKRFNWKSGNTYGFLLHAEADSIHRTTTYTAYFRDVSENKWYLIASFKRPQTVTNLTHLYSFLENFIPETGDAKRMGVYKNQWIANEKGEWHELTDAIFTIDATAKGGYRKDYAGGIDDGNFFLMNDGFFNEFVKPNQTFKRNVSNKKPQINFTALLQQ